MLVALACLLGAIVGSFLNVVIHRLPRMLEARWQRECQTVLAGDGAGESSAITPKDARFDLAFPPSHCPKCERPIRWFENMPLLGYLSLRGRCAGCGGRISLRYPLVELLTAVLSGLVAWRFGPGLETAAALVLVWFLIAMAFIDYDTQLLPDSLTLPLLWIGLLLSLRGVFATTEDAVVGAAAGYLSLWSVYQLFKKLTGREGMGYGDFKLLAALGAWLGWKLLLPVVLISSAAGAIIGGAGIVMLGRDRLKPIPFGPFLCIAGGVALFYGQTLLTLWLGNR